MASWDDEDYVPVISHFNDEWEEEDKDGNAIKDNWDDEEEEEEKKEAPKPVSKKKKPIDRIKEKEEKRKQEMLAKMEEMKKLEEESKELTVEEELEEKRRRQKLQEESDLELAKDAFGVGDLPGQKTIDNFIPANKEEFLELSNMIVQKFNNFELRVEYPLFLETLIRDSCAGLEIEEIKKIANMLNVLVQEKQKLTKSAKGKKKAGGKKNALTAGKGVKDDLDLVDDGYYNEYEDFM